jgi:RNA polymerase sigma factor (sigma-70 family)
MTLQNHEVFTLYVVDDDDAFRESLAWLLRSRGYVVQDFPSAEDFLSISDQVLYGCLLVDVRMPGASGIELHDRLVRGGVQIPTLVMSGHGDLNMALSAFRKGAVDFLEKPIDDRYLLSRIEQCMAAEIDKHSRLQKSENLARRFACLAPREKEVLDCILAGLLNKQIAAHLGISIKTVEVYRSRVMEKLQAKSLVDLVKLVLQGAE